MNNYLTKTAILIATLIGILAFMGKPASADEPKAVGLESFTATPLNNAVRIDWETGSESGTLAFRIKRGTNGSEQFLDYLGDNGYIYAEGGVAVGHDYSVTDDQVQNGDTHTYILIEVENDSSEIELDRVTVTVGIPPTSTPAIIPTNSGTITNPGATNQGTATVRPTATATPNSQSNNSATAPTSTPRRIVTVTPQAAQPENTATPTAVTIGNSSSNNQSNSSQSGSTTDSSGNTAAVNIPSTNEVFAQEEAEESIQPVEVADISAPQSQEDYPALTPTTVTEETYPNNPTAAVPNTGEVPVIGNSSGYNPQTPNVDQPKESRSFNTDSFESNLFLWLGFIVALLIFATGLVGSIILFTRKVN